MERRIPGVNVRTAAEAPRLDRRECSPTSSPRPSSTQPASTTPPPLHQSSSGSRLILSQLLEDIKPSLSSRPSHRDLSKPHRRDRRNSPCFSLIRGATHDIVQHPGKALTSLERNHGVGSIEEFLHCLSFPRCPALCALHPPSYPHGYFRKEWPVTPSFVGKEEADGGPHNARTRIVRFGGLGTCGRTARLRLDFMSRRAATSPS